MYREIKKILECTRHYFLDDAFICQQRDALGKKEFSERYYVCYSNAFEKKWEIRNNENSVIGCFFKNDIFIYHLGDKATVACNIKDPNSVLYDFNYSVSFLKYFENGLVLAYSKQLGYFDLELETGKIAKHYPSDILGFHLYSSKYYISLKDFASVIYVADANFNRLWERDISEECQHEDIIHKGKMEKGRIQNVILYKEEYVIISTRYSHAICLELATGKEIWRSSGSIYKYAIVEDIAYCTTGGSLWKLNLNTGKKDSYFGEHHAFPDFNFEGHEIFWPNMLDMHYHEGLLWFIFNNNSTGFSFIITVNPETGNYEWIHKIDTKKEVRSMKFHQNRIYISGRDDLLIYEKE